MPHAPHQLGHTPATAALLVLILDLAPGHVPTLTLALRREIVAVLTVVLSHPPRGAAVIPHPVLVLAHAQELLLAAANVLHTVGLDPERHLTFPDPGLALHLDDPGDVPEHVPMIHVAQVGAGLGRSHRPVVGKHRTADATAATQDLFLAQSRLPAEDVDVLLLVLRVPLDVGTIHAAEATREHRLAANEKRKCTMQLNRYVVNFRA